MKNLCIENCCEAILTGELSDLHSFSGVPSTMDGFSGNDLGLGAPIQPRKSFSSSVAVMFLDPGALVQPQASFFPFVAVIFFGSDALIQPQASFFPSVAEFPVSAGPCIQPQTSFSPSVAEFPLSAGPLIQPQASFFPSVAEFPVSAGAFIQPQTNFSPSVAEFSLKSPSLPDHFHCALKSVSISLHSPLPCAYPESAFRNESIHSSVGTWENCSGISVFPLFIIVRSVS